MKKVILLLNMGGPNNLDEVEIFLKNMFNDPYILNIKSDFLRSVLANLITFFRKKDAKSNYERLGGKSPIVDITKRLVDKVEKISEYDVDFIMRYTPPFAIDVLSKYKDYNEIILFPLYPQYSKTTILSSLDDVKMALKKLDIKANIKEVEYFYKNSKYNEIIVNLIKDSIEKLSDEDIAKTSLIFSAHSLPKKMVERGDIYEEHIKEHVDILTKLIKEFKINFKEIRLAYQSKLGPVEWLGPNLSEVLKNLKSKRALVIPMSFCIDNSETDFELDIEYREIADEEEFEFYEVVKCPNDKDEFASFINKLSLEI
ncbi:ferrochelatase [Campylobacter blaseri]|uniref:Ferrochelatase n=1 Tax=Campylobacter blaseri TaxID=2042961 RepID=A0A2P8R059_9BACT|nr:ferrochelatase [Campylobacter blaseri]PSM51885.1 ferrochelatase [Campylobacter blaseri]PSM53669.1 ferrochelatase [Campylobacter blaseri]QKF85778.1 ferrochelatase [Campylobacter blaseri]